MSQLSNTNTKPRRNANIELLRIISILMVTMLHALGKSDILKGGIVLNYSSSVISWVFESLSVGAVNIFMLISGYFLVKSGFKLPRLIELICQTLFYTVLAFVIGIVSGILPLSDINIYYLLNVFLPIHMNIFWFITIYLVIYILSPILAAGVNAISKKQFQTLLILLLIYECVFKSILPFVLTVDESGYNLLWCIIVFLSGAYIRLYGSGFLNSFSKGISVYLVSTVLIFAECVAIKLVAGSTGRLAGLGSVSTAYNHIFVFLASVGIFTAFLNKKEVTGKAEKVILFLSPMTLGVYLFHENITFRYEWTKVLGINASLSASTLTYVLHLVLGVLTIFVIGSLVDFVRSKLFNSVRRIITKQR